MSSLADNIEVYIKQLINEARRDMIEISRAEIASLFECVPSQINYVLQTRFSPQQGYLIESRRGGGGYIRILRVNSIPTGKNFFAWLFRQIGDQIAESDSDLLLRTLEKEGYLTKGQSSMTKAIVKQEAARFEDPYVVERIRAALLRATLFIMLNESSAF